MPLPTDERRAIVQALSEAARYLDGEAERRRGSGTHDGVISLELHRASGSIRLVATLIVQGRMSTRRARFWARATADYLDLVRSADRNGVIA